jgi:peptidoglycan/xylan/chitin deacetylase (PgdA/CDA1 family)
MGGMTIEDVRRISEIPQVTLGAHTVTHPALPTCTDSQIDYELGESKRKVETWIGKPVRTFTYPFGRFDGREQICQFKW